MITTARILAWDGRKLTLQPDQTIDRVILQKHIGSVELRLNDGRTISNEQRRKIFAVIAEIARWSGNDPEYIRGHMTWEFCARQDRDYFSLSDVDVTTARRFLDYLIEFCFNWNVPTRDTLLNQTDDIGRYLYMCLEHRKCAICNAPAQVHHVDRVGMGRDREEIVHEGLRAIALCADHHDLAHRDEKKLFDHYHIYGIELDKYLCRCLRLKGNR